MRSIARRCLRVPARRCGFLDRLDQESAFHDAYLTLLEKHREGALDLDAMHPRQVFAYLAKAAVRNYLAELKRAESRRTVALADDALSRPDPAAGPEERTETKLESALRELVEQLPERRGGGGQAALLSRPLAGADPAPARHLAAHLPRDRALDELARRYQAVREGASARRARASCWPMSPAWRDRAARYRHVCTSTPAPPVRA